MFAERFQLFFTQIVDSKEMVVVDLADCQSFVHVVHELKRLRTKKEGLASS